MADDTPPPDRIPVVLRVVIYVFSLILPFVALWLQLLDAPEALAALTIMLTVVGPGLALAYTPDPDRPAESESEGTSDEQPKLHSDPPEERPKGWAPRPPHE